MTDSYFTCAKCNARSCADPNKVYPSGCLSSLAEKSDLVASALAEFNTNEQSKAIAQAAAAVEAEYYCLAPRAEEIVRFARKMGYKKIGIASCIGLLKETQQFAEILEAADLIPHGVTCKVGRTDKTQIGVPEKDKLSPGNFESMCNPILQAMLLNQEATDFNVIIGLCVGHDSLFIKYAKAPVTTLVAKDRVFAHNTVGALYTLDTYSRRLLDLGNK